MGTGRKNDRKLSGASTPVHITAVDADQERTTGTTGTSAIATVNMRPPVTGSVAVVGPTELIPAPGAGFRIVIPVYVLQNESGTATTIWLREGAVDRRRLRTVDDADGIEMKFDPGREWRLPEDTALNIRLSGANQVGYTFDHFIERV